MNPSVLLFCVCVFFQDQNTALHLAAMNGNVESAKLLLSMGAEKDAKNMVSQRVKHKPQSDY